MQHALQIEILKELIDQIDSGKNVDAGVQYRMPVTSYVCRATAEEEWQAFFQNHPQVIDVGDLPVPAPSSLSMTSARRCWRRATSTGTFTLS